MRSSDGEVVAMENRAIRITIELPEGLGGSMGPAARVAEATEVTADSVARSRRPGGVDLPAQCWAGPEPAGAPIDAGAPPAHLIAALGGEAGLSGQGSRRKETARAQARWALRGIPARSGRSTLVQFPSTS